MSDHFFMTLPSDSSMDVFPSNKITNFKTQLSKRVTLIGEWEVGLTEIHIPYTFNTISAKDFWIGFQSGRPGDGGSSTADPDNWTLVTFPEGMYSSAENILSVMRGNEQFRAAMDIFVHLGRVTIRPKSNTHYVSMSAELQRILNFPTRDFKGHCEGVNPCQPDALIPSQIYVYSDVAEPQYLGDVNAPILRIINIEKHKNPMGASIVKIFTHPHYIPVSKREFNQIEIDIRDHLGNPLPFTNGQLNVKLHFRKVK